jgi:hypothetical protein
MNVYGKIFMISQADSIQPWCIKTHTQSKDKKRRPRPQQLFLLKFLFVPLRKAREDDILIRK